MAAIRYLAIGSENPTWTSAARRRALVQLGRDVRSLGNYYSFAPKIKSLARIEVRTAIGPGVLRYNSAILRAASAVRPDIVWIESAALVWPRTLKQIKESGAVLVHYTTDDLYNPGNFFGRNFRKGMCSYDFHITTNIPNVSELTTMGLNVIHSQLGYDHEIYFPRQLTGSDLLEYGAEVSFIGHWERATELVVEDALKRDLPVRVWGWWWQKAKSPRVKLIAQDWKDSTEEYAKAICACKINLGFVSGKNRSQTAGRTFEIPACGGFLLAPRTDEAAQVYEEDKEAVFFGDAEELVDKALFYLNHDTERKHVAEAGHRRCITSGYSWLDRMRNLIPRIEQRLGH